MPHQHFQHFDPIRATGWKMQFLTCKDNTGKLHVLILVNPEPNYYIFKNTRKKAFANIEEKKKKS